MALTAEPISTSPGWLRDRLFDLTFIIGIAALALVSGAVVAWNPALFLPVVVADLWLLGYHHVVATFTRLCFDRESFRTHRFLVVWLPFLVFAGVLMVGFGVGLWALASLYLYWQWFHFTRQSWEVAQTYRRNSGGLVSDDELPAKIVFWAMPAWGILHRSVQDPGLFLGIELRVLSVPEWAADTAQVVALLALAWWLATRALAWWRGRLALAHTLYMATHFLVFGTAYVLIDDITHGWLVINIWHNAQYVVLVWMFNSNRFRGGIDPNARFLSRISQPHKDWIYFGVCVGISGIVYLTVQNTIALILPALVVYHAINFHHYIVDAVIWKVRGATSRQTQGISGWTTAPP